MAEVPDHMWVEIEGEIENDKHLRTAKIKFKTTVPLPSDMTLAQLKTRDLKFLHRHLPIKLDMNEDIYIIKNSKIIKKKVSMFVIEDVVFGKFTAEQNGFEILEKEHYKYHDFFHEYSMDFFSYLKDDVDWEEELGIELQEERCAKRCRCEE
tara:strand:- start:129 stop:584 length:456 start_codon:yes stop_codon:yes gene_type:complete